MNSPVDFPRVEPRPGSAIFFETARLAGIQTVAGFAVFGLYLADEIGHDLASILIWVFALGVLALRQFLWALGRKLDNHSKMPANQFDDIFAWVVALPLAVLGAAVHWQWI